MKKIIPHIWFDKEAVEAANFYASVFPDSKVNHTAVLTGTPSGDCDLVSFNVMGTEFQAISAGPYFKLNPAISFMVNFDPSQDADAATRIEEVWTKLSEGGKELMAIGEYPFSKRYGWVEDKFGVSWQLILTNPEGEPRPAIIPSIMFAGDVFGKAEEASDYYISIFKDSKRGALSKYPAGIPTGEEGTIMFTDFMLERNWFAAMDAKGEHNFKFTEAISFMVMCEDQEEIDHYWQLSAVPESEQCGWLKDKYGVSWQIVPTMMDEVMWSGDQEKIKRITEAFLQMKKFNLAALKAAM